TQISPHAGPVEGGTYALVTGKNFQEGAQLFIGRAPATELTVSDALTLVGRTPGGSVGAQDVEVTNPDGQSALLEQAFSYSEDNGAEFPSVNGVSPLAGPTQGGTTV